MDVFVAADRVAADRDRLRIVDVRDEWEYDGIGHLPGAVNVPFATFRSEAHAAARDRAGEGEPAEPSEGRAEGGDRGMLPSVDAWERLLSEAGIGPDDEVVAYDDTHGVYAARFLVTAELYGHDPAKLHLLDGDYSAWSREREVSREPPTVEPTAYAVREPERSPLVDFEDVVDLLGSEAVVVDTREPWEYEEGHLPGAVLLDWMELVDAESRGLKPRDEIESILESRGITPDRRVLLYCNTARRISHTYLVLRHLGYEDLLFYEGSLTEWEARGGELATGAE